ncbi:MAG: glycosyltransferase family 39 protein [Sphaerochaetaceae bacterium]|nr:glycosyltransferase family 39 protein [Sphaerochaetaceae bacterium]
MNIIQINKHKPYLLGLTIWCVFLLAINIGWLKLDKTPQSWDQSNYIENSQNVYLSLTKGGIIDAFKTYLNVQGGSKAPLITLLPIPFYLILGYKEISASLSILQFIPLLIFSTYALTYNLFKRKDSAFLSALLVFLVPLIYCMSRQFLVELPLVVIVVLYLAILTSNTEFTIKKNIVLGTIASIGILTKITFPLYVIIPTLIILFYKFKDKKFLNWLIFIYQFLIPIILIALPWYLYNFNKIISFALSASYGELSKPYGPSNPLKLSSMVSYLNVVLNSGISKYLATLGLISILIFYKKISNKVKFFLISWLLIPLFFLITATNKDIRYTTPFLPIVPISISSILLISFRRYKYTLMILILLFPLISFLKNSFIYNTKNKYDYRYSPQTFDWQIPTIINSIHKYKNNLNLNNNALILFDEIHLNANTFSMYDQFMYPHDHIFYFNIGYSPDTNNAIKRINDINPSIIIYTEFPPDNIGLGFNELSKDVFNQIMKNSSYMLITNFKIKKDININLYAKNIRSLKNIYSNTTPQNFINNSVTIKNIKIDKIGMNTYINSLVIDCNQEIPENINIFFHAYNKKSKQTLNFDFDKSLDEAGCSYFPFITINKEFKVNDINDYNFILGLYNQNNLEKYDKTITIP